MELKRNHNKWPLMPGRFVFCEVGGVELRATITRKITNELWEVFHYTNGASDRKLEIVDKDQLVSTQLIFELNSSNV